MSTKIRVRSPYFLKYSDTALHYVELDMFVYQGGSTPSGLPRYEFKKYELGTQNYVVFEISDLVRDFLDEYTEFDGTYSSSSNQPLWLTTSARIYDSSGVQQGLNINATYLCFDAYSDFEDGMNYEISNNSVDYFLTTATKIRKPEGVSVAVALNVEAITSTGTTHTAGFYKDNVLVGSLTTITDINNTTGKIAYVESGTDDVDEVRINVDSGVISLPIITQPCSKYDPIKLTYYNKLGALQDLFFFAKSMSELSVKEDDYKTSALNFGATPPSYDTAKHQYKTFNKQGKEKITINTGLVGEEYNDPMTDLMLSEKVWMTKDGTLYPVKIASSSFEEKTSLNDKIINYTVELEYAFDRIQNIR